MLAWVAVMEGWPCIAGLGRCEARGASAHPRRDAGPAGCFYLRSSAKAGWLCPRTGGLGQAACPGAISRGWGQVGAGSILPACLKAALPEQPPPFLGLSSAGMPKESASLFRGCYSKLLAGSGAAEELSPSAAFC